MNVREGIEGLKALPPGSVATIGNFDGVHVGHRQILAECETLRGGSPSGKLAVVTFEPHPLTVLRPELAPPRLTLSDLKRELLRSLGVDEYVVLPPTPDLLGLSAETFWQMLNDDCRLAHLVEGDSFTFGKGRSGTVQKLKEWSAGGSLAVHIVPPVERALCDQQVAPVSSSLIRFLIDGGRMRDATTCLGRPYRLDGLVVQGFQRGRTIGVPTANLDCGEMMIPADGVYAARCTVAGVSYLTALSIGTMPTFGEHRRQVEAFLLDFSGDLYGHRLQVDVLAWLRDQWKLPGIEALKAQIARDVEAVREIGNARANASISSY